MLGGPEAVRQLVAFVTWINADPLVLNLWSCLSQLVELAFVKKEAKNHNPSTESQQQMRPSKLGEISQPTINFRKRE